jgi:adenylate kinase
MNRTVIVTGIPGSGKTTVCSRVEKLAKNAGVEVNVINYGTVMMRLLQKHGRGMERDDMRRDNLDTQRKLQKEVAGIIVEKMTQLSGLTIVDTHMSIKTPAGYLPGLPSHNLSVLKPDMLVLVEAEPREISRRRMKDATRKRDAAVEEAVREELLFSRFMAGASAVLAGAPVKIVVNAEGRQEEAAKEIFDALEVA